MFCHPDDYRLGIREMQPGAIIEVDSLEELVKLDADYLPLLKERDNNGQ